MRKTLLVDDSKSARYALKLLLQKHDCEVDVVESGEVALQKINETPPDVIFMDHMMPGMNGFEALDAIKSNPKTAHIPVVMCTSNDEEVYQIEAQKKGAIGILPKPAKAESIADILVKVDAAISVPRTAAPAAASKASTGDIKTEVQPMLDKLRAELEQTLTAKFTEQLTKLRADLHQRESEYAQAIIQKIAKDVLPQVEQRILQRLSQARGS